MVRINPDPHDHGYEYAPHLAVTAFFPADQAPDAALRALEDAGFDRERIDVFTGPDGADRLDPEGQHHGRWVRFRKALEEVFSDDRIAFHGADETLRSGGTVVEVFTHGEKQKREQAVAILKGGGGRDVIYWGKWVNEYM
jgi:hypothetical protein